MLCVLVVCVAANTTRVEKFEGLESRYYIKSFGREASNFNWVRGGRGSLRSENVKQIMISPSLCVRLFPATLLSCFGASGLINICANISGHRFSIFMSLVASWQELSEPVIFVINKVEHFNH